MEDWAEIVKTVRKKEKLTQREFAKKIGVSSVAVSHWEQGNFKPRMKERRKLAEMCKELKIDKGRDEEIIGFISTLIGNIPTRKLNDERLHIICGNGKDCGTLREYICERMNALFGAIVDKTSFGVIVEHGEEKKE